MIFRLIPVLLFFFCSIHAVNAQEAPIKWGKLKDGELNMTLYPKDSSAAAVVLCDYGNLHFDFNGTTSTVLDRHKRIKILTRAGFDYADVTLTYYKPSQRINQVDAQIFHPDGSSEKLKNKDIFSEDIDDEYRQIKFTLPNVQEGSVIEYRYSYEREGIFNLPSWYFQSEIPVAWSEYHLAIPDFYRYIYLDQGGTPYLRDGRKTEDRYYIGGTTYTAATDHLRIVYRDLPGLKEESYITTMDDYLAKMRLQLSATNFNGVLEPVLSNWLQMAGEMMDHDQLGQQILNDKSFRDTWALVENNLPPATDEMARIQYLYDFVNNKFKWNGEHSFMASGKRLDDCLDASSGNSADLNLLLVALLRKADIEARPTLITTRGNGKPIQAYPMISQFNHCIVHVTTKDDKELFLETGNKYYPMGLLHESSLNKYGWVLDQNLPQWKPIPTPTSSSVRLLNLTLNESGVMEGRLQGQYNGYIAASVREDIATEEESTDAENDDQTVHAAAGPQVEMTPTEVQNLEDIYQPLRYKAQVKVPQAAQKAGNMLYVSTVLDPIFTENPFKLEKRAYPVDIPNPFQHKYILNIVLPEGYALAETPEPITLNLPAKGGYFRYRVTPQPKNIQVIFDIKLSQLQFTPEEYPVIKKFFDLLLEKQQEQLILKRKS